MNRGTVALNIVFDFGGVLFDWDPLTLLQRLLPHRATDDASGRQWAQAIFQGYQGDWGAFDRGVVGSAELVQRIARRTGLTEEEVARVVDAIPSELRPKPGVVSLLRRLHAAGRTVYYLSNMPAPYAAWLESTHDFFACFTAGIFSSRVHHNKPEAAIYEAATARFGVGPQTLLFIDDHPPNIAAAQALGWQGFVFGGADAAEAEFIARGVLPASADGPL